jgi:TonB-dependent SusC/RagA subfamily outer membrane receptor
MALIRRIFFCSAPRLIRKRWGPCHDKMRVLLIIILTLSTNLTAQSQVDSLVLSKDQNDRWIVKLERETKVRQLDLVRKRILSDTNIYVPKYYPDRIKFDNEKAKGKRSEGYCRPLLVFNAQYYAYIDNGTKEKSIKQLVEFLTDSRIESILIMKDSQATALYGSRATCGVILLTTKDKKTLKRIKEIDLTGD